MNERMTTHSESIDDYLNRVLNNDPCNYDVWLNNNPYIKYLKSSIKSEAN